MCFAVKTDHSRMFCIISKHSENNDIVKSKIIPWRGVGCQGFPENTRDLLFEWKWGKFGISFNEVYLCCCFVLTRSCLWCAHSMILLWLIASWSNSFQQGIFYKRFRVTSRVSPDLCQSIKSPGIQTGKQEREKWGCGRKPCKKKDLFEQKFSIQLQVSKVWGFILFVICPSKQGKTSENCLFCCKQTWKKYFQFLRCYSNIKNVKCQPQAEMENSKDSPRWKMSGKMNPCSWQLPSIQGGCQSVCGLVLAHKEQDASASPGLSLVLLGCYLQTVWHLSAWFLWLVLLKRWLSFKQDYPGLDYEPGHEPWIVGYREDLTQVWG